MNLIKLESIEPFPKNKLLLSEQLSNLVFPDTLLSEEYNQKVSHCCKKTSSPKRILN